MGDDREHASPEEEQDTQREAGEGAGGTHHRGRENKRNPNLTCVCVFTGRGLLL